MDGIGWIFLYLVLPFITGILGNIATPWVTAYFDKGTNSWHAKRTHITVTRYRYVRELRENPRKKLLLLVVISLANMIILINSITALSLLLSGSSVNSLVIFTNGIVGILFFSILLLSLTMACILLGSIFRDIFDATNFENYREKTIKKLIKLGGNPEDLDKEEANG